MLHGIIFIFSSLCERVEQTFLACMFYFPNSDHVMFFREFDFCLFDFRLIHVHKTTIERNNSVGYHNVVFHGKTKHTS